MRHRGDDRRLPGPGRRAHRARPCRGAPGSAPGRRPGRSCSPRRCRRSPGSRPWPPAPRRPSPGPAAPASRRPWSATSISDWPTPTVSSSTMSKPAASKHPQRLRRGHRQPAEVAAGGHRPDVDPGVQRVRLHPHPVAEQGTAGERRARIDGQHADPPALLAQRGDQRGRRGGLAHPGRTGQADDLRPGRCREPGRGRAPGSGGRTVLDQADRAADRPRPARADRRRPARPAGRPTPVAVSARVPEPTEISSASPCPPPPQSAATPVPPPRRRSSYARVSTSRAPEAPIGCPSAIAPPLTLTRSSISVLAQPQGPGTGHADRGERLVDLDQVQVRRRDLLLLAGQRGSRWPAAAAGTSPARPPCRARRSRPAASDPAARPPPGWPPPARPPRRRSGWPSRR